MVLTVAIETKTDTTPLSLIAKAGLLKHANDRFRDLVAAHKVKNATEANREIQADVDPLQGENHPINIFCTYNLLIKSK